MILSLKTVLQVYHAENMCSLMSQNDGVITNWMFFYRFLKDRVALVSILKSRKVMYDKVDASWGTAAK